MFKKVAVLGLGLFLVLTLILSACAAPAPAPAPTPTPTPVPETPKVIELKFTDAYADTHTTAIMDELFAKMVNDKTEGRVKITMYHAESLGKQTDFLNLLSGGVCDIATISPSTFSSQFFFENGLELPFLGIPDRAARDMVTWELYNQGYLKGLNDFKLLAVMATGNVNLFLRNKVTTLDGLQGLKIRGANAVMQKLWEVLGASGIFISAPEVYMALDRGVIDGMSAPYEFYLSMKLYEVAKYMIWNPPFSSGCIFILMRNDRWNKLPKDVQSQIDLVINEYRKVFLEYREPDDQKAVELIKEKGADLYDLSAEETEKLLAAATPIQTSWIAEQEANGLPAKEMMTQVQKILTKYYSER